MKQPDDIKTLEIPELKTARRGRPPTGKSRDANQRKRDQLERDLFQFNDPSGDISKVTESGLLVMLGFGTRKPVGGYGFFWNPRGILAKDVWLELGRRRGFLD